MLESRMKKATTALAVAALIWACCALKLAPCDESIRLDDNTGAPYKLDQVDWWKKTNFYHIYLRSFKDSNGDGNGDLRGVTQQLDYLKQLGVETVLMAPFYSSPMKDCGYDIDDYEKINPMFGDLRDFDELVRELHARQMKLVVDFVPNHSSNKHKWFECSERALLEPERCGKYKDYYVWTNSTRFEGRLPSNWISFFGGTTAWQWSDVRKEFYLHQFLPEQPDLNFNNAAVREEFKSIARFWFRRGADGLRVDSANVIMETAGFPDEPKNDEWRQGDNPAERLRHIHTRSLPESATIVKDWRQVAREPEFAHSTPRAIITEAYDDIPKLIEYYGTGPGDKYADLPFNFELLKLKQLDFHPRKLKQAALRWIGPTRALGWPDEQGAMSPWIIWVTGNHDNSRLVNRVGANNAYLYKWLSFIMPGVPVVYSGDEIFVHDANFNTIPDSTVLEGEPSRLPFRAPMAWTHNEPAGDFTSSQKPWMPVNEDFKHNNVQDLMAPEASDKNALKLHMKMQQLRARLLETFVFGDLVFFDAQSLDQDSAVLALARFVDKRRSSSANLLLLANLGIQTEIVRLQEAKSSVRGANVQAPRTGKVVLTNFDNLTEAPQLYENSHIHKLDGLQIAGHQVVAIEY